MFQNGFVSETVDRAASAVAELLDQSVWALASVDMVAQVRALEEIVTKVRAMRGLLIRELSGRGWDREHGATSMATWLRDVLRVSVGAARRVDGLGRQLDARPQMRAAVDAGVVNAEQAQVIRDVLAELPADLGAALVDKCESVLIEFAAVHEPSVLRRLGERILDHVAPEVAEAALAKKLEREEAAARQVRALTIRDAGDGTHRVFGRLDTESAAVLRAAIDPLCQPIPGISGQADPRTPRQRRADALIDVCRFALAHDDLPVNGGNRPQTTITVGLDAATKALSAGTLDMGGRLSPGAVRRLCCDAQILPAVLGSGSEVLDVGRERRLFTGAIRRAIVLRDRGCAFPGCDRPPRWCDAHHAPSWLDGGPTSLKTGVLLCGFHHRLIHEPDGWQVRIGDDGFPDFIPPPHIDPERKPLRNTYWPRT